MQNAECRTENEEVHPFAFRLLPFTFLEMGDFIDIAGVEELPVGRAKTYVIGERRIALCHTDTGFYALDNTCPHRGGPLGEGDLIGDEIICPWHLWSFDVATGNCMGSREVGVAAHEVKIEGSRVLVRLAAVREVTFPELL
jgi:nitrite reductase (NADH) small subunit